ncbi:hypothetical protein [Stenotrophomonas sp. GZD-301]|uniref:hypothetical protein n=1 Tax=Stenotrophomonas sp. GZD-301 TaxID=3404814 RepID=UPI003BB72E54
MTTPDPDRSAPRLLGFDVPDLQADVDPAEDEAITAMLDIEPSEPWLRVFDRQVEALKGELGLAGVLVSGRTLRFYGSVADSRRLANEVTRLIHDVTAELRGNERMRADAHARRD